jgi:hypothetical protein
MNSKVGMKDIIDAAGDSPKTDIETLRDMIKVIKREGTEIKGTLRRDKEIVKDFMVN